MAICAVLAGLAVCRDHAFKRWAQDWLKRGAGANGTHELELMRARFRQRHRTAAYRSVAEHRSTAVMWAIEVAQYRDQGSIRGHASVATQHATCVMPNLDLIKLIRKAVRMDAALPRAKGGCWA